MIYKLSEEIYARSIQLKKYNARSLFFKKNRIALEKELYRIQESIKAILHKMYGSTDFTLEEFKLTLFMSEQLYECIIFLSSKCKNYRSTVCRIILGFHNLPRALLSADNPLKTTTDEAMAYYKPYIKAD